MRKARIRILAAATALLGAVAAPVASASAASAAGQAIPQANGTSLCASNRTSEPFNFLIWSGGTQTQCIRAYTTIRNPGTLSRLTAGTAGRAWMHENADGTGWADCFSPGSAWSLLGTGH
jgi:hypothetical protein